jgi:hypothetical protein
MTTTKQAKSNPATTIQNGELINAGPHLNEAVKDLYTYMQNGFASSRYELKENRIGGFALIVVGSCNLVRILMIVNADSDEA